MALAVLVFGFGLTVQTAAGKAQGKAARQFMKPLAARFKARDFGFVEAPLQQLAALYPLNLPKPVDDTKMAAALHDTYCAACHDEPDIDGERPAFKLTAQAQEQSAQEFFARLVVGVRGDRRTGLSNPFTDRELAALFAYYRGTAATNR